MASRELTDHFRSLHLSGEALLMPNPWDAGSARLLTGLGFHALATTSSGYAMTLGRFDGSVSRAEALTHAAAIVAATALPVSADLENGFADSPDDVAALVRDAVATGLAGCSIEDHTTDPAAPIYESALAADRVRAAAEAAHGGAETLLLTARAENYLHDRADLRDTISRLQAFQDAGADVLYAPGLVDLGDITAVVTSVDRPVNVLLLPNGPSVAQLCEAGVRRISVGGAFAYAAAAAVIDAGQDLLAGRRDFMARGAAGRAAVGKYFAS